MDVIVVDGAVKLWLDDLRDPVEWTREDDWTWVKTYRDAIYVIDTYPLSHLSLDNDIGDFYVDQYGETREHEGYEVLRHVIETNGWPEKYINVHSSNAVRMPQMIEDIQRHGPFVFRGRFIRINDND